MRIFSRLAVCVILFAVVLAGCAQPAAPEEPGPEPSTTPTFKIGILTGTVSQGEDEYRAAEQVKAKYGDRIVHVTYPDNFMQEQETTISQLTGLAADPDVRAIVVCQAVPGTAAAIDQIRETRDDITFVVVVPHEDVKLMESKADIMFETNNLERGNTIVQLAKDMGATHFLHYSFPRHMSMELLATRRTMMEEKCKELGIEFVFVTAPDPMGPDGIPGAQRFILEDVPRQVAQYGKDICVFSTNCGMQEPLIKAALQEGAIFAEQCCPSPTHGYPNALGLDVEGIAGDMPKILEAIEAKIVEEGGAGRFASWPVPINMVFLRAGVELAMQAVEGKIELTDEAAIKAALEAEAGVSMQLNKYSEEGNFWLAVMDSVIFGK
jgi:enoyl-CoA hydratase/carnithine racemase